MTGNEFTITFLGTGSSIPPDGRQQVSFALRHPHGLFLFDCGEGTQYNLRKFRISIRKEIVICISHLHSDHFLGVPGLLSSLDLLDRKEPIIFVGPKGIEQVITNVCAANFVQPSFAINIVEMEPNDKFRTGRITLTAINALHEGNALSYILEEDDYPGTIDTKKTDELGIPRGPLLGELQDGNSIEVDGKTIKPKMVTGPPKPGRKVVYSGDTLYNPNLIDKIPPLTDLLVHEGTYPTDQIELAEERNHSTISQAAEIAEKADVNKLAITHISPRVNDLHSELIKAKRIFKNTIIAEEGKEIILPYPEPLSKKENTKLT